MSTPTRLLLCAQRAPTNEQHRQASNNAALNEDRTGIQSSHCHHHRLGGHASLFLLLYPVASEIEVPHPGPGRQVKVGIADLEDDQLEDVVVGGGSGSGSNGRSTSWSLGITIQVTATTPA
jgi:hypothetical protein